MDGESVQAFLAIVQSGGFSAAASNGPLSQSALSRQIQKLERELGVELFDRRRRGAELTPAGASFVAEARDLVQRAEAAKARVVRVAQGTEGELRIGFVGPTILSFVPPVLSRFRVMRPRVQVTITETSASEQVLALASGQLDLGFLSLAAVPAEYERVQLGREEVMLALPSGHAALSTHAVSLTTLRDDPWVLFHREFEPALHDFLMQLCASAGFAPRVEHRANRAFNLLGLVAAGLGVAFVPRSVADRVRVEGVSFRPLDPHPGSASQGAAWLADNPNPALPLFLDAVREMPRRPPTA